MGRIASACTWKTPIGHVFVTPVGVAHHPSRIGECRGRAISTPELSDYEIGLAGLTGKVRPASEEANRLHGKPA